MATFLDAVSNNHVKLVKPRSVHFALLKSSSRFQRLINKQEFFGYSNAKIRA